MNPHTLTLSAIAALLIAGCAETAPRWEKSFGDASRQLRAQQTLDAAAPARNAARQPPVDGVSTLRGTDRYRSGDTDPADRSPLR